MNQTELFLGERPMWPAARLELDDVQALWGGRRIVLQGDGTAVLTIVSREGSQQTRHFSLPQAEVAQLFQLCVAVDLVTIMIPERMGTPDEARLALTLVNGNGRRHAIAKWANDKHERFDALYAALLKLEKEHE
jgi:hypothetical protein